MLCLKLNTQGAPCQSLIYIRTINLFYIFTQQPRFIPVITWPRSLPLSTSPCDDMVLQNTAGWGEESDVWLTKHISFSTNLCLCVCMCVCVCVFRTWPSRQIRRWRGRSFGVWAQNSCSACCQTLTPTCWWRPSVCCAICCQHAR